MNHSISPDVASNSRGLGDSSPADLLEQLWQRGEMPEPTVFLAQFETVTTPQIVEVLLVDQRARWQRGDRPRAEAYLANHPSVRADAEAMLDLVYGEYLLAEEQGEKPRVEEYARRFPALADALRVQVELHHALPDADEITPPGVPFPSGDGIAPALPGYEILGKLGRGGMGVVYQARQTTLKRLVAIKVILAGAQADAEHQRRFQREAEAVASLRHPNVVQVYDHGTADSCPYLVLEYVEGGTLAQKTAGNPQPPAEAARVVETLAAAIEHAHQQGLVHRDLKPANVLLTADGVLKIADFGLVKQLDTREAHTASGALVGTPSHMAPEQVAEEFGPVGPATDVYALGVILYELLTGRLPFQGGMLAVLQQIKEQVPARPSRLRPGVPRDLETICLKCLEKAPARRYASAAALAEDLRHFQLDEPITARPVGTVERARRWARRRPAVARLLAALAGTIVLALAGLTALWLRAEGLRDVAESNHREAATNLEDARANLTLARQAIDQYSALVRTDPRLREALRPLRKELLQTVVPFYERLIARYGERDELGSDFGRALTQLGQITMDIESFQAARERLERARDVLHRLSGEQPDDLNLLADLARAEHLLGGVYSRTGQADDAVRTLRDSLARWQRVCAGDPERRAAQEEQAKCRNDLATVLTAQSAWPEALEHLEASWQLRQALSAADPDNLAYRFELAVCRHGSGLTLLQSGDAKRSEEHLGEARAIFDEVVRRRPDMVLYQRQAATNLSTLAGLYLKTKRLEPALDTIREANETFRRLTARYPEAIDLRRSLVGNLIMLGGILNTGGKPDEGRKALEEAVTEGEGLLRQDPDSYMIAMQLGPLLINLASSAYGRGDHADAVELCGRAIPLLEVARKRDPKSVYLQEFLLNGHFNRALARSRLGQYRDAAQDFDTALSLDNGALNNKIRYNCALALARTDLYPRAVEEARALAGVKTFTGRDLYRVASVVALALAAARDDMALDPAARAARQAEYTAECLALLRRAAADGYRNLDQLQKDAYFAALRDRPEFEKLFAELGTRQEK